MKRVFRGSLFPAVSLLFLLVLTGCKSDGAEEGNEASALGQEDAAGTSDSAAKKPLTLGGREFSVKPLPPGVRTLAEVRPKALSILESVVDREASKPGNAWALAHGILAKGSEFSASDGRRAVNVLVDDFLQAERVPNAKGLQPFFPKTKGEVRVEPHTDLILKAFVEAGLPLDEPLTDAAGAPTLERLLRGSRVRFVPGGAEQFFPNVDDIAWSTQAWCQAVDRGAEPSWQNSAAQVLNIETIAMEQLKLIEREYHFIQQARAAQGTVEKRRQHIFAHACGGAHLLQSTLSCAAMGFPEDRHLSARINQIIDAFLWRVPFEISLIDRAIREGPRLIPILLNQDIKFLGHGLEALGKAERDGLWKPSVEQIELLGRMEERLLNHVLQLNSIRVYDGEKMASLAAREHGFQFYLDLVGDACHAWAGLKLQEEQRARRAADVLTPD